MKSNNNIAKKNLLDSVKLSTVVQTNTHNSSSDIPGSNYGYVNIEDDFASEVIICPALLGAAISRIR